MNRFLNYVDFFNRSILRITGDHAENFLQNIITTNIKLIESNQVWQGALLSPQGKILISFLILRKETGFWIDVDQEYRDSLLQNLKRYSLHQKITIDLIENKSVRVLWGDNLENCSSIFKDTRFKNNPVYRDYGEREKIDSLDPSLSNWQRFCLFSGIATLGIDYQTNELFPHDVNFDCIGGLSFNKGCYIGQEVTARVHHLARPKKRLLIAYAQQKFFEGPENIFVENHKVGKLYAQFSDVALAVVRIDVVSEALEKSLPVYTPTTEISFIKPTTACFDFPIQKSNENSL